MTEESIRLSKRLAAQVPCSRSEAERYIEGGWVRVDGQVVDVPQARVSPAQAVTLDRDASLLALTPVTILFHAEAGGAAPVPTAANRSPEDRSGIRVATSQLRQLQPLLPLPRGAGGLAVFSQDGRIVRKLQEDAAFIEQEWMVDVEGQIAEGGLARLGGGLMWRNQPLPPVKVSWQSEKRLRFALKGIDPSLVPWMCEQVRLHPVQGRRLRVGRVPLAGLAPGQWRCLMPHERF